MKPKSTVPMTAREWAANSDRLALWCASVLALAALADTVSGGHVVVGTRVIVGLGNFWVQMFVADLHLQLIESLTLDEVRA